MKFGINVNLKIDKDGNIFLIYVVGNDIKDYIEDVYNEILSEDRCNEIVNFLLELNVYIDLCNKKDVIFFYIVSNDGYISIVEFLLSKGVNINLCDKDGVSFFCILC